VNNFCSDNSVLSEYGVIGLKDHPDKNVPLRVTNRDEIVHDFKGSRIKGLRDFMRYTFLSLKYAELSGTKYLKV